MLEGHMGTSIQFNSLEYFLETWRPSRHPKTAMNAFLKISDIITGETVKSSNFPHIMAPVIDLRYIAAAVSLIGQETDLAYSALI